jgi:methylthioxylose transferase
VPAPAVSHAEAPASGADLVVVDRAARRGLVAGVVLVGLAIAVPLVTGWSVHATSHFPHTVAPLHAVWHPVVGVGTPLAALVGWLGVTRGERLAGTLPWRRLLAATYAATLAWTVALALVYGPSGLSRDLNSSQEYLVTARTVHDVPAFLSGFVARIPFSAGDAHWPIHVAGHPPAATLFFVGLVGLGLGSSFAAGCVVTLIGTTTPVAVLVTMRRLGAEDAARRALPYVVLAPAAIWVAVSGDAVFAAIAAWGLAALAVSVSTDRARVRWSTAVLAGLLLGLLPVLSYGLVLVGVLVLAVLVLRRGWRVLPVAAVAATIPTLVLAGFGFYLWQAYPVLHQRYWDGLAPDRPAAYWMWASLGALLLSTGPALGAGLGALAVARRTADRAVLWLVAAGASAIVLADASQMSKAEVERIWLPFVPWLLLSTALLPPRWRRPTLVLQVVAALLVEHLLDTGW